MLRTVSQRFCHLLQDVHLLDQERLQCSFETIRCVSTGGSQGWGPRGLASTSRTKFVALASKTPGLGLDDARH